LRGIIRIIGVLVITVDNRGQAGGRAGCHPEIIIQVAVARAGDAALADTAIVDYRGCLNLREAAAGGSCAQVLCHIYIPGCTIRIAIGRSTCLEIRSSIIDDIDVTRIVGGAPGEDGCLGRRMVHLNDRRPVLSLIGRVAVIDVVIVTEHRVNVAGLVDAHVREIVIIADLIVGAVVHHVVGEALASISGNCHPDSVIGACTGLTASYLTRVVDTIEGLVDDVATGIDHQIPDLVVVDEEGMIGINSITQLSERRPGVVAAVDIDVKGRDVVVGDADLR